MDCFVVSLDVGKNFDNPWIARKAPVHQISGPRNPLLINTVAGRRPNFSNFYLAVFGDSNGLEAKKSGRRFLRSFSFVQSWLSDANGIRISLRQQRIITEAMPFQKK